MAANFFLEFATITGEEIGLLLAAEQLQKRPSNMANFKFENYNESRCKLDFRFEKMDIVRLKNALLVPDWMTLKCGRVFRGIDGLCILLRRLAYPNRLADLQLMFGRLIPELSEIVNHMLDHIYDRFASRVTDLNQFWMQPEYLHDYAAAIGTKNCPLAGCFGFIDGTILETCRPTKHQKELYSGHKRTHGLKYQSLVLPNGLIANIYGPEPGRRHDSYLLRQSGLLEKLEDIIGADNLYIFGDSGYPLRKRLITPFVGSNLSPEKTTFIEEMSKLRISVEWEFAEVFEQFAFLRYKYNQKVFMQPVAKYIAVAVLLKNCQTCLYGCQTAFYFKLNPPSLENYLSNRNE